MTSRRELLIALGAGALSLSGAVFAQSQLKVWRIGVLHPGSKSALTGSDPYTRFFVRMRELGYVEGRDIAVQWQFADNDFERLPDLAAQLVKQKVNVIITNGTPAVGAAQQATRTIPIVALSMGNPVKAGFAASLARPGGNVTGMTLAVEIGPKRLELLSSVVPGISRIAHLFNPDNPGNMQGLPLLETAARKIGKELVLVRVRTANELSAAFEVIARERAGALLVEVDSVLYELRQRIGALAIQHKLATMFGSLGAAEYGLMIYGPRLGDLSPRAAVLVDRIFKGAKPGDLPIEQPTKFELVINMKIAKALGLTIPQELILRADKVIE